MKAMILAAGLGTRLRPLTNERPKALVEVAGRTMLELAVEQVKKIGVNEIIVNTHHFAGQVEEFLRAHDSFGMRIAVSQEDDLLDTGGGIKKAAWFFLEADNDEPFLVHNVDVLSTIDLAAIVAQHREQKNLATLAVQQRASSRQLLFSEHGLLCGRRNARTAAEELVPKEQMPAALAFTGIHVLSPRIFARLSESGAFSIIDAYLRLARDGERIAAFRADPFLWRDLGKPESVRAAEREMTEFKV